MNTQFVAMMVPRLAPLDDHTFFSSGITKCAPAAEKSDGILLLYSGVSNTLRNGAHDTVARPHTERARKSETMQKQESSGSEHGEERLGGFLKKRKGKTPP